MPQRFMTESIALEAAMYCPREATGESFCISACSGITYIPANIPTKNR